MCLLARRGTKGHAGGSDRGHWPVYFWICACARVRVCIDYNVSLVDITVGQEHGTSAMTLAEGVVCGW